LSGPSAAEHDRREASELFSFAAVEASYRECRRRKRGTVNALRFEVDLERNLSELARDLQSGSYTPRRSVCFLATRPKLREVIACDFRDRVVHHLLVKLLEPRFERVFIHDSYASRKGKGTHAALDRLREFIPKVTRNHSRRAWFAHLDVRSFFPSIDRRILFELVERRIRSYPSLRWLAALSVFHDPTAGAIWKGDPKLREKLPLGKSLFSAAPGKGLPIGNHTSQFFANVYLNEVDHFMKHNLRARYSMRYVDDLMLLSTSRAELEGWKEEINSFLRKRLLLELNDRRSRIAPLSSGIDFLGYVTHPRHRLVRRRVVANLKERLDALEKEVTLEEAGYQWVCYRERTSEYLEAMLASYRSILERGDTWRLRASLRARYPWLERLYPGPSRKPFWRGARAFSSLAAQAHAFRERFSDALVALEVGRFLEVHGAWAEVIGRAVRLKVYRGRRVGTCRWTRFPRERLAWFLERGWEAGIEKVVLVGQDDTGTGRVLPRRTVALGVRAEEPPQEPGTTAGEEKSCRLAELCFS
jgi:RNA-directed DNA polymerase